MFFIPPETFFSMSGKISIWQPHRFSHRYISLTALTLLINIGFCQNTNEEGTMGLWAKIDDQYDWKGAKSLCISEHSREM